jgi:hypothetical protein
MENSEEFLGKMIFQNFFRGKFNFFPTFFGGKIFPEIFRGIFPGKMYEKSVPGFDVMIAIFVDFSRIFGENISVF